MTKDKLLFYLLQHESLSQWCSKLEGDFDSMVTIS